MMGIPAYFVAVAALIAATTAIEPQECPGPNEWFTAAFVSLTDKLVPLNLTTVSPDVDFRFFREIMHFSEEEIEKATEDAITFFRTKFGLDFSNTQPNDLGQRFFENAIFSPFVVSEDIESTITFNRWIVNGRTKSICFKNRDGGFLVSFTAERTLFGTYGGSQGKVILPGGGLTWGFHNIPVCPQQPLVIRYESGTPFRTEPVDGIGIINCDLYHRELGEGTSRGIAIVTPTDDPDIIHFSFRTVFTFPRSPGLPLD